MNVLAYPHVVVMNSLRIVFAALVVSFSANGFAAEPAPQELFSEGKCEPAAVLAAAEQGEGESRRNQLCYAHLYLGLYFEALGDAARAREHIAQAAGPFRMDHYMGKVAVMHAKLRGWPVADAGQ